MRLRAGGDLGLPDRGDRSGAAVGLSELRVLGRIHPMKDFDALVRSLRSFAKRGSVARLIVAVTTREGAGPKSSRWSPLTASRPAYRF